jgi:hypothetical protein
LFALPEISNSELDVYFGSEMNKSIPYSWDFNALGMLEIHDLVTVRGGVSLGMEDSFNIDAFALAGIQLSLPILSSFNISYILNAYSGYKTTMHSIFPYVSADLWRFELTLGYCFKFVRFDHGVSLPESSLAYRVQFHVIDSSQGNLSVYAANFSDFMCGNNLAFNFGVTGDITLSSRISITGNAVLMQTGSDGLTSSFYGVVLNGGVRICLD